MALLPREQQNPVLQRANDLVGEALSRRLVFLVGHKNREIARKAARDMALRLGASGSLDMAVNAPDSNQLRQMGALYFPYRLGLLSSADRELLQSGQGRKIAERALTQVFGVFGFANAELLHGDPFLLLPGFLSGLPTPLSHLSLNDGLLSLEDKGVTWVLIAAQLNGNPFALDVQTQVAEEYRQAANTLRASDADLEILHLGAVFFAKAGADQAMNETSKIGIISTLGSMLLVLMVFRGLRPLLLSLLVIAAGVLTGLSATLYLFGELHVVALLFGISLIGVSVDYSLQYCSEVFSPAPGTPRQRLRRVLVGITLGTGTTVIGYLTLFLAPFPGLHQIAAFSAIGLLAALSTVVFWLPLLDRKSVPAYSRNKLLHAERFLRFWEAPAYRRQRRVLSGLLIVLGIAGFLRLHADDNVRHMQSLSSALLLEQDRIQQLVGMTAGSQFFLVQAKDDETALQTEEKLAKRLRPLVVSGELAGFQSPAEYIPSMARQTENRELQAEQLYKVLLAQQTAQLGLNETPATPEQNSPLLTLAEAKKLNPPPVFLSTLLLGETDDEVLHRVALDAVAYPETIAAVADGIPGVRLIDPAGDFSVLLGKYRSRAIGLLALSAGLMAPLLIWRYGLKKGLWVMIPPLLAVVLTAALRSLAGAAFTFFDAMALVLVLSIGVDYAVFCAETTRERRGVTMLAVTMAAGTALLSFGLLAFSQSLAVHAFGASMSIGVLLSFLFAPLARLASKEQPDWPIRSLFSAGLLILLSGCATPPTAENPRQTNISSAIRIAPEVVLQLPDPAELGRPVEASQLVTADYGGQSYAFTARISATPEHFLMVGLDLIGRKLLTIDWQKDGITYEKAKWLPAQLQPENILADIVLLYWPDQAVRHALSGSAVQLLVNENGRAILAGEQKVWQADYQAKTENNRWSGKLHYRNLALDYEFSVQSVEGTR